MKQEEFLLFKCTNCERKFRYKRDDWNVRHVRVWRIKFIGPTPFVCKRCRSQGVR